MKDLIAKLHLDANCAMGAIWLHIEAQAARIAELEAQIAAKPADTDKLREALSGLTRYGHGEMYIGDDCDFGPRADGGFYSVQEVTELFASTALQAPVREVPEPNPDLVEWIVNDMGELGVRVDGICYFCYKGESLVYENGKHDDGTPILHRNVGKREFGEVVYPAAWQAAGRREPRYLQELVYTPGLSFGSPDDTKYKWLPLPAAPVQEPKP